MASKEELEKTRRFVEKYAALKGLRVNEEVAETIIEGLTVNKERYGFRYCPCRIVTGDRQRDMANICPCDYHIKEIEQDGCCHCMIFCAAE